jgi:hypothetical protein
MSLNEYERETIVNASDGETIVRIWTAQRRFITRLRRSPRFTEVATGHDGATEWAEFTIPADLWTPTSGAKRSRTYSDKERNEASARLQAVREARQGGDAA